MKHPIALTIALCAVWLLWSGYFDNGLLLALGGASVLFVLWLTRRMATVVETEAWPFGPRLLVYIPWLLWQIFVSNITVARIILSPKLPISPRLVRVKASQVTEIGQVIYANSITLTPGTISLDLRRGEILVHALTQGTAADLETGEMDRRITRLERTG